MNHEIKCATDRGCTKRRVYTVEYRITGFEADPYIERIIGAKTKLDAVAELQRRMGRLCGWPAIVEERIIHSMAH